MRADWSRGDAVVRRILPLLLVLAILLGVRVLVTLLGHHEGPPSRDVLVTRLLAVGFFACDVALGLSMVYLLILGNPRAASPEEKRLPVGGAWLWYLLVGLAVLCYVGLAPTFIFLYLRMTR
jgi:hypothetical protein